MILKQLVVGGTFGSNCYVLGCPNTKEGMIIDPGGDADTILKTVEELDLKIKFIVNTHGHLDHIAANGILKKETGAGILIHSEDAEMLTDPKKNLSSYMGQNIVSPKADKLLQEGDNIVIGDDIKLEVLHTPGHSKGGICLVTDNYVFTGDTLFAGSIGRTDFPGGNHITLLKSVQDKIFTLSEQLEVHPGHGPKSTVGEEKSTNPFFD
ncbi:glyoxylase-like metal-dependent hydrolase (beta-lactamase superfamily II) [Desulfitispora alkaliphila]|uniref:MBL fold metallo-hydrolase n=1 Tax=Desulfitispora alkaliphila TaxID=622674 RepID=UPI003D23B90F